MVASQPRPFRLVGEGALRALRAALGAAVSSWAREWGAAAQPEVSVRRAWEASPARPPAWNQGVRSGGLEAWLAIGADSAVQVQHVLFPPDPANLPDAAPSCGLAEGGARQALEALADALATAALGGRQQPRGPAAPVPAHLGQRGSGAVCARIVIGRVQCEVLLNGAAVQALQDPAAPLPALMPVDPAAAVAPAPVTLRLHAGRARVSVGALLALAPGDVIRLDRAADAPLALATRSGHPLLAAYLGRRGDRLAVELVDTPLSHSGAVQ